MGKRYREALAELAEAERLSPDDPTVARLQALAWLEMGEQDRAAAACERALRLSDDNPWTDAVLGHIRILQGRYAEARDLLQRAVRGMPAEQNYLAELGRAYYFNHEWQEALQVFERVLRAHPEDTSARWLAARACLALGRTIERARSWPGQALDGKRREGAAGAGRFARETMRPARGAS